MEKRREARDWRTGEASAEIWSLASLWSGHPTVEVARLLLEEVRRRLHPDGARVRLAGRAGQAFWRRQGRDATARRLVVQVPVGVGQSAGLLTVWSRREGFPTRRERLVLAALAGQAASALGPERGLRPEALAGLAHDVRTPVTSALTAIWLLRDAARMGGVCDLLCTAARNLKLAAAILTSVVDLGRPRRPDASRATAELPSVLDDALAVAKPEAEARGVRLAAAAAPEVAVQGEHVALARVFVNLLVNAVGATPRGGEVSVEVRSDPATGEVLVLVRDSGIGIAEGDLERIFQPFERGTTSGGDREGAGLGLAVVRQILADYGGTVVAASPGPGRGSTFSVRLVALRHGP